jgi:GGDEF domain-containing protein
MSALDVSTSTIIAGIVVVTAAVAFLLETVVRRDSGPGRYWAAGFAAAILVTVCYAAWAIERSLWVGVAVGNAAFVAQMGLTWLGCLLYNARLRAVHRVVVALAVVIALAAALVERDVGDWAGAPALFVGVGGFAALVAAETRRGRIRRVFASWGLTLGLGFLALFYAGRTATFLTLGPDSALFADWFGTQATSLVLIVLMIATVVSTSALRVASAGPPGLGASSADARGDASAPGPLPPEILMATLEDLAARCARAGETVAVVAIRMEGLRDIAAAFGQDAADLLASTWRDAAQRHLPLGAPTGVLDDTTVAFGLHAVSPEQASAAGDDVRQRLIDELAALPEAVLPAIGVGFALSADLGHDAHALAVAAQEAATRSAAASGLPVVRADA